jgi:hypothetical protein
MPEKRRKSKQRSWIDQQKRALYIFFKESKPQRKKEPGVGQKNTRNIYTYIYKENTQKHEEGKKRLEKDKRILRLISRRGNDSGCRAGKK